MLGKHRDVEGGNLRRSEPISSREDSWPLPGALKCFGAELSQLPFETAL